MGTKQTKQSNQLIENENHNNPNANSTLLRAKRQRKSTSSQQLNRTSSSPVVMHSNTKWRMSTFFHDVTNGNTSKASSNDYENRAVSSSNLTSSKSSMSLGTQPSPTSTTQLKPQSTGALGFNQQMKSNQQRLTNIIKQADASQPSYHLNSKLYRPSSFLLANSNPVVPPVPVSNRLAQTLRPQANKTETTHTLPRTHVQISPLSEDTKKKHQQKQSTPIVINDSNAANNSSASCNNNKIPVTCKIAKKLGLSPRFKRKIVETITNRVSSHHTNSSSSNNLNHKSTNSIFSQSRLIQALQSQWNLFSSIRLSRTNLNQSGDEHDAEDDLNDSLDEHGNKKRFFHRHQTTATFLSTSLQRNSFRYASRRKYKTQSLANPFRHADTNYPVYIHEALFMPEFSVKGQVTEADFEILDVISRGAFGHVIKVKKKTSERSESEPQIYAMKIMWKSQVIRDRALQQVKDEVTIAINCGDNPLIVKTWHYWQSKRFLYIITDYVENGELLSLWLKVHHFPERLAILYAVEMSLVLDYLHKRGIIYRDIKMENILLDQRGHIQLIDFGLSKWLKLGERTGTICGTIQYMAPEILSVEPYDHSVDWWSLGILIYALLSGEYPLNAAKDHIQMNEKVSKHVFELDRSRGNYTEEACDLVRKLLRKSPQRRLKSLNEIRKEPFFLKEVNLFVSKTLETESSLTSKRAHPDQMSDAEKRAIISENFWNPYVIMENYSPLQMLFDEIYAMKQKQQEIRLRNKANKQALQTNAPAPVPPPPPPPPPLQPSTTSPTSSDQLPDSSSSSSTNTISSNKSLTEDEEEAANACLINNQIQNNSYENNNANLQSINEYDGDNDDEDDVSISNSFTKF